MRALQRLHGKGIEKHCAEKCAVVAGVARPRGREVQRINRGEYKRLGGFDGGEQQWLEIPLPNIVENAPAVLLPSPARLPPRFRSFVVVAMCKHTSNPWRRPRV